jgi:hypothetical protein
VSKNYKRYSTATYFHARPEPLVLVPPGDGKPLIIPLFGSHSYIIIDRRSGDDYNFPLTEYVVGSTHPYGDMFQLNHYDSSREGGNVERLHVLAEKHARQVLGQEVISEVGQYLRFGTPLVHS